MKTILADSYWNESLYLALLQDRPVLTGTRILPFSAWLNERSTIEADDFALFSAGKLIEAVAPSLQILKPMTAYPAFIRQTLDFYESLVSFGIPFSALPTESELDMERKRLLEALSPIQTAAHQRQAEIGASEPIDNVVYLDAKTASLAESRLIEAMKKRGLTVKPVFTDKAASAQLFHAMNARQEIECCAQWIVKHRLPLETINLVLCNPSEMLPYLHQIFPRYRLDYGVTSDPVPSQAVLAFVAAARYFQKPDANHFKTLLRTALFADVDVASFLTIQKRFCWPDLQASLLQGERDLSFLSAGEKNIVEKTLDKAEQARQIIAERLALDSSLTPLEKAYELLRGSDLIDDPQERSCLVKIQQLLNRTQTPSLTPTQSELVLASIQAIQKDGSSSWSARIAVSDLDHPLMQREVCFVLGANSKNYPQSAALGGLYEEEYVARIPDYPSKLERAAAFLSQREWIFYAGRQLFFSYAESTVEGKALECAAEIKRAADSDFGAWPLEQNDLPTISAHTLSPQTARQLFVKNGRLKGSISSFERYWRCPYSYFLAAGLRLYPDDFPELDQARIGTLQHACIETCIERYGSSYAKIESDELRRLIDEKIELLKGFFQDREWEIESIRQRCFNSLSLQFEFLRDLEKNTDLIQHQCEVEFHEILFENDDVPIELTGFIDRIDANLNLFRVLDYKSSAKSLSQSKIEAGLQLQLLTYLFIAAKLLNKKPVGAYYYSLKNADVPIDAAKLSLRKSEVREQTDEDGYQQWIKQHRLSGQTVDPSMENDRTGTHIVGWSAKGPGSAALKDFEETKETLLQLYRMIRSRLLNGEISCTPTEGACQFCDYGSICRYSGQLYKRNVTAEEIEKEREQHA